MDNPFASATELAAAIKNKAVSSIELIDLYIDRIKRYDGQINAVVVHDFERGRAAAKAADAALARGEALGPLHGVPMTAKESFNIEGLPTTWGIPELRDNIATRDAELVRRLKGAGAVFFGKTNVPLNLGDFQSFNEIYGTTNNPWHLGRTPGGSSGGSSAALAAGLTGLEAGADTGGSIRNPAHFCGIYGHKPTGGILPDEGHALPGMAAPLDITVVGPMARSAADLALSISIVAGPGRTDTAGWQLNLPGPAKGRLQDFRVAILPTHERAPVSTEMADRVQQVGDRLARLGAAVSDAALPNINLDESFETYTSLLWGVMAMGLSEAEKEELRQARAAGGGDDSIAGSLIRFGVQEHSEWSAFNHRRFVLRKAWQAFFRDWDIFICPQMATDAFPHDHGEYLERRIQVDNASQDYFQQLFWAGTVNVAHLPSTVFPTGPSKAGLPIGLQAVGGEFNDYTTIEFARLMADEIGGFRPPPDYP